MILVPQCSVVVDESVCVRFYKEVNTVFSPYCVNCNLSVAFNKEANGFAVVFFGIKNTVNCHFRCVVEGCNDFYLSVGFLNCVGVSSACDFNCFAVYCQRLQCNVRRKLYCKCNSFADSCCTLICSDCSTCCAFGHFRLGCYGNTLQCNFDHNVFIRHCEGVDSVLFGNCFTVYLDRFNLLTFLKLNVQCDCFTAVRCCLGRCYSYCNVVAFNGDVALETQTLFGCCVSIPCAYVHSVRPTLFAVNPAPSLNGDFFCGSVTSCK